MAIAHWLWDALHELFETNDGSLPEVHVNYVNPEATIAGYALLRSRTAQVITGNPYFWSTTQQVEQPLDSVKNAAELVVSGEAESFHVVFGGIEAQSIQIPDLGVFVFPNQLALDYRMGAEWGPTHLHAFFHFYLN